MDVDVSGRVGNIKLSHSHALLPLFEAIVNSMDALSEVSRSKGEINVHIERDDSQRGLPVDVVGTVHPVKSFIIADNGIGFTDANYKAFNTSDTRQKAAQGGKGVGRLLWLKAFDHAEINSVFIGSDGKKYRREFQFRFTAKGIEDHSVAEVADADIGTIIRLCDYRPEYQQEAPRLPETIARKIIEHCLQYFVLELAPKIIVHDSDSVTAYDLHQVFADEVRPRQNSVDFVAGGLNLTLHNLRVSPKIQGRHKLYFCAGNRAVVSETATALRCSSRCSRVLTQVKWLARSFLRGSGRPTFLPSIPFHKRPLVRRRLVSGRSPR